MGVGVRRSRRPRSHSQEAVKLGLEPQPPDSWFHKPFLDPLIQSGANLPSNQL